MYLRPDTLFRPRKFDIYLNAPEPTGNAVGAMGIAYREGDGDLKGII